MLPFEKSSGVCEVLEVSLSLGVFLSPVFKLLSAMLERTLLLS